jgi:hypothetical protein
MLEELLGQKTEDQGEGSEEKRRKNHGAQDLAGKREGAIFGKKDGFVVPLDHGAARASAHRRMYDMGDRQVV